MKAGPKKANAIFVVRMRLPKPTAMAKRRMAKAIQRWVQEALEDMDLEESSDNLTVESNDAALGTEGKP
jgi:hypothetical protein